MEDKAYHLMLVKGAYAICHALLEGYRCDKIGKDFAKLALDATPEAIQKVKDAYDDGHGDLPQTTKVLFHEIGYEAMEKTLKETNGDWLKVLDTAGKYEELVLKAHYCGLRKGNESPMGAIEHHSGDGEEHTD